MRYIVDVIDGRNAVSEAFDPDKNKTLEKLSCVPTQQVAD